MSITSRLGKKTKAAADSGSADAKGSGALSRLSSAGMRLIDQGTQAWYTPWSWADTRRVYHGDDGFWAYFELPDVFLYDGTRQFRDLLAALKSHRDGLPVHLLQYAWSAPAQLPEQTPPALAQMLSELTELHGTLRCLVLGVKLEPRGSQKSSLIRGSISGLYEGIDAMLGELVPDFDDVEGDYQKVEQILSGFGARAVHGESAAHLDSWYLLGANTDPTVVENETSIDFGTRSTLSCLSAADLDSSGKANTLPAPGPNAVICASVRGKAGTGQLADVSVVLARRSSANDSWIAAASSAVTNGSVLALPMRQLPALSETLPCSSERVTPDGTDFTVEQLASLGVTDPVAAGDRFGLSLGLAGADYSDFAWWNPSAQPGQILALCGQSGCGKSVLAEYLAIQALAVGYEVRYLSADGESGRPLLQSGPQTIAPVTALAPGLLNPGAIPHDELVQAQTASLLDVLISGLGYGAWKALLSLPDPADYNLALSLEQVPNFAPDQQATARIMRAQRESELVTALLHSPAFPAGSSAVAIPRLIRSAPAQVRDTIQDLLVTAAVMAPSIGPVLVVADGAAVGPLTKWAMSHCRKVGREVSLVVTARELESVKALNADVRIAGANGEPSENAELLAWMGLEVTEARQAWMRQAFIRTLADQVITPPAMLLRDRSDRTTPIMLAPLPTDLLSVLTRGKITGYRS